MWRFILLAFLILPGVRLVVAQINSTRETSADWYCCEDQACKQATSHQRYDTALTACVNKSIADGKTRWVQGGRYRISVTLPQQPSQPPSGGSATISWVAPTQNDDGSPLTDLAGFRVLYGNSPSALNQSVSVTGTQAVIPLTSGTWYFAVRAVNSQGVESVNSEVVSKTVP